MLSLFAALMIGCAGLLGGFVWTLPQDALLTHAVSSSLYQFPIDIFTRPLSKLRVRLMSDCPSDDISPNTPIGFVAAAHDHPETKSSDSEALIQLLVERGCDINAHSGTGTAPLHDAVLYKNARLVGFLLDLDADPDVPIIRTADTPARREKIIGLNALEFARYLNQNANQSGGDWTQVISLLEARTHKMAIKGL